MIFGQILLKKPKTVHKNVWSPEGMGTGGTRLVNGRGSVAHFSESNLLLIAKTCHCTTLDAPGSE